MAQRPSIIAHAWDPYHGDRNNRHPRLGAPVPRRVPADLWRTFTSIQPAIHSNGVYADIDKRHPLDARRSFRGDSIEKLGDDWFGRPTESENQSMQQAA
jgi:hypothetical protein